MNVTKKETSNPTRRVFLSYAPADRVHGHKLRDLLSQWSNLLNQCDVFIVLLSPHALTSLWVLQELGAAWGLAKPIVPVVTDPERLVKIPMELRDALIVDIKDLENPEMLNWVLERYKKIVEKREA
jgi:hypothetical protein